MVKLLDLPSCRGTVTQVPARLVDGDVRLGHRKQTKQTCIAVVYCAPPSVNVPIDLAG